MAVANATKYTNFASRLYQLEYYFILVKFATESANRFLI
jgi:hypothetical protein